MTTDNVVKLRMSNSLPALAQTIRIKYESAQHHDAQWVEDSIALGKGLVEARMLFPSDTKFGEWLAANGSEIEKNDRAALIGMAVDPDKMREVLTATHNRSWRLIWDNHKAAFPAAGKANERPAKQSKPQPANSSWMIGMPRVGEVHGLYRNVNTRTSIANLVNARGGKVFWDLILQGIDHGWITANSLVVGTGATINLRLLFPQAPPKLPFFMRHVLTNARHRDYVLNVIWPVALANREAVIADPTVLERLVATRPNQNPRQPNADVIRPLPIAKPKVSANEREIVAYGQTFWPRIDRFDYSYDECRAAAWFFCDLYHLCSQSTGLVLPKSRAMGIRAATRAIQRFANHNVVMLVDAISLALENNPEGECQWPLQPADGKW